MPEKLPASFWILRLAAGFLLPALLATLTEISYLIHLTAWQSDAIDLLQLSTAALPSSLSTSITSITPESSEFITATNSLPIYLLNTSINATAVTTWGTLLKSWNRTAEYSHLWNVATEISSLPYSLQHSQQSSQQQSQTNNNNNNDDNRRTIILIHCGPKTGSSTLRAACKKNYERTCPMHVIHPPRTHEPFGYIDETKLYPLIDKCRETTHFCAKQITIPPLPDLPTATITSVVSTTDGSHDHQLQHYPLYTNTTFLHLFPFRNYNEWSASALKQQFDRGHQKGCDKQLKLLQSNCTERQMELDLRKYGKAVLSKFKEGAVRRMLAQQKMHHLREQREQHLEPGDEGEGGAYANAASSPSSPILSEQHIFLLYHHRELNSVLSTLAHTYQIPTLPGSDGHGKSKRPEGTCDAKILEMFHACFSWELTELK